MFGPNNERLIVSTEGGSLLSYDVASGECVDERCDNEMEIPDITFSSDQMLFIAAVSPASYHFGCSVRAAPLPVAAHAASLHKPSSHRRTQPWSTRRQTMPCSG